MDIKEQYCTKKEKGKWKRENEKTVLCQKIIQEKATNAATGLLQDNSKVMRRIWLTTWIHTLVISVLVYCFSIMISQIIFIIKISICSWWRNVPLTNFNVFLDYTPLFCFHIYPLLLRTLTIIIVERFFNNWFLDTSWVTWGNHAVKQELSYCTEGSPLSTSTATVNLTSFSPIVGHQKSQQEFRQR